jgi:hypothetical protein
VYEWPQKIEFGSLTTILADIAANAVHTFSTSETFESMDINERYKFREETFKWTNYVDGNDNDVDDNDVDAGTAQAGKRGKRDATRTGNKRKSKTQTVDVATGRRASSRLIGNSVLYYGV